MSQPNKSVKHTQISKSNSNMFIILGVAGAILSFTFVTGYTFIKRMSYQNNVISERVKAEKQLKANVEALDSLVSSYKGFDTASESVIGTADANSKIVLDALPSKYDFPALATSLEKLLLSGGFSDIAINGSDSEASAEQNSTDPVPVEIPFTISARGSYDQIQALVDKLQRSIRPFKILKVDLTGSQASLNFTLSGVTYYQPEKNLDIPLREVK